MAEPGLYERLGGIFAIAAVVDSFSDGLLRGEDQYTLTVSDVLVIPGGVAQPVRRRHRAVPLPQRNAIQVAFAMTGAAAPDLFRIASKPTVSEAVT